MSDPAGITDAAGDDKPSTKPPPPTPLHLPTPAVIAEAVDHLQRLRDDLRWAFAVAYGRVGRGLDASRGAVLATPPDPLDPDAVPGATYDFGVGDTATRDALAVAVNRLALAERYTAEALDAAGSTDTPPAVLAPTRASQRAVVVLTANGVLVRLLMLRARWPGDEDPAGKRARPLVLKAWQELSRGADDLAKPLRRGHRPEVAAVPNCTVCDIRPQAVRWSTKREAFVASAGGRCKTCMTYYTRSGGTKERPRSLDNVDDAIEAQARRAERGEGWGEG